jgi:hypothetical protein
MLPYIQFWTWTVFEIYNKFNFNIKNNFVGILNTNLFVNIN